MKSKFFDERMFEKIYQSDDYGLSILQNKASENELKGIYFKTLGNNER